MARPCEAGCLQGPAGLVTSSGAYPGRLRSEETFTEPGEEAHPEPKPELYLLARILFANAVMAALLIWMGGDLAGWLNLPPAQRAARLALCVVCGAAAYFAALFLSGTRLRHVRNVAGA